MSDPRRTRAAPSRAAAARAQALGRPGRRTGRVNRTIWVAAAVVAAVGVAAVIAVASGGGTKHASPAAPASTVTRVVNKVVAVPPSVLATVGKGSTEGQPQKIDAPPFAADAKPRVLYVGAEYCPFCAAERWPLVLALSKFGTFSHLGLTHSATEDVYPDTQTLSFHGSTYRSQYLDFEAVETQSNQLENGRYATLDTPTAEQQRIFSTYNAPPYVAVRAAGSIPFIYFGGKYLSSGAGYSPEVLKDKSADEIASALPHPDSPITQGVVGTANTFVAALCTLTGNQPANVCSAPGVATSGA